MLTEPCARTPLLYPTGFNGTPYFQHPRERARERVRVCAWALARMKVDAVNLRA